MVFDKTGPQSQVIARSYTEKRASGETGKLCKESHSVVFILVRAVFATVIGHSKLFSYAAIT